jgi:hypothetical protein
MRVAYLGLLVFIASATAAQALCEDDMNDVRVKVAQAQKTNPSPQTAAAAKELTRYDDRTARAGDADELDCRNTMARVERDLKSPPRANNELKPGQAAGPVNPRAGSVEEQAK